MMNNFSNEAATIESEMITLVQASLISQTFRASFFSDPSNVPRLCSCALALLKKNCLRNLISSV